MVSFDDENAGTDLRKKKGRLVMSQKSKNATPIGRTSFERAMKSQSKKQSFKAHKIIL